MKNCRYLITAAGASTIGEACHIGAPIILIPEKGQIEGELNSKLTSFYYPNACTIPMSEVSVDRLTKLTTELEGQSQCNVTDGSKDVANIINQFLEDYYSA
jgi:UDP-N-acetylglucosamine:LPS N-acetylglucosamine transferase